MDTSTPILQSGGHDEFGFRHDCVRDLAWAVFSSPMVRTITTTRGDVFAPNFELTLTRWQQLQVLDTDPTPLLDFLHLNSNRYLGIYFETLWRFFLLNDPEVTLLKYSQQMIEQGRTLGEFDIFYHCHRRDITVHLELAVKFYLGMPVRDDMDLRSAQFWLGPNCADRLDLKLAHLRTHQLPLLDHHIARQWLDAEKLQPQAQEIALHGYLYSPYSNINPSTQYSPSDASPSHLSAFWIRATTLSQRKDQKTKENQFRIVPKMEWLCAHDVTGRAWHDFATLQKMIDQEYHTALRQPVLCEEACLETQQVTRRFFVAPNDWPALHWPKRKF